MALLPFCNPPGIHVRVIWSRFVEVCMSTAVGNLGSWDYVAGRQ